MKLHKITISGANEHTDIKELIALTGRYYQTSGLDIELGVQMSPTKAFYNSDRYQWLMELHQQAFDANHARIDVALHVNPGWVEQVCVGVFPLEIIKFMGFCGRGGIYVQRIQLNFLIGREEAPDMEKLYWVIREFGSHQFILTYNEANRNFIQEFYRRYGKCFHLLVDESHGKDKTPEKWQPVVFPGVFQAYSGGLSPDNIEQALDNIAGINTPDIWIGIDAEGKLKGDDGHLSLAKADAFMQKVQEWYQKNTQS